MPKKLHPSKQISELLAHIADDAQREHAKQQTAASYGFCNWRQLEVFIDMYQQVAPKSEHEFVRLVCLDYQTHVHDIARATLMVHEHPDLSQQDIYNACSIGDVKAVRDFVRREPSWVTKPGGYFGWEPLLYACYSRLDVPGYSTLDVAKFLLDNGANPNAYFMWGGQYRFTAVTGAFGEGENGSTNSPAHPHYKELARALLDAGADPNDGQALYNRMFTPNSDCLRMLIEYGIHGKHLCNWLLDGENDELLPCTTPTLSYQLRYAIKSGYSDRARMCTDAGADLSLVNGETPFYEQAMLAGDTNLADYLVEHGAEKTQLETVTRFAAACQAGDETAAREMLEAEPDLMRQTQQQYPEFIVAAAEGEREPALRVIAKLGGDLNAGCPMQQSAWQGQLNMVKLLIELGCNVQQRDPHHHATPLQWASHHGDRNEIIDFLSGCDIDIFDAILCNNIHRIQQLLDQDGSQLELTLGELRHATSADRTPADARTPLVSAIVRKREDIVRFLLEKGANTDYSEDGRTLRDLAREHSTPGIVELLTA